MRFRRRHPDDHHQPQRQPSYLPILIILLLLFWTAKPFRRRQPSVTLPACPHDNQPDRPTDYPSHLTVRDSPIDQSQARFVDRESRQVLISSHRPEQKGPQWRRSVCGSSRSRNGSTVRGRATRGSTAPAAWYVRCGLLSPIIRDSGTLCLAHLFDGDGRLLLWDCLLLRCDADCGVCVAVLGCVLCPSR